MRVFQRDGTLNFVDDNNVVVGFDASQEGCEYWGWGLSPRKPETPQSAADYGLCPLNNLDFELHLPGWRFDPSWVDVGGYEEDEEEEDYQIQSWISFRLIKGEAGGTLREQYLVLYNFHDGYCFHGFAVQVGATVIRNGYL